ncbi:MAG: glycosyltransferase family 2 protein [Bacteroidales bacterium]|nr:glycosyltransferase family 2 protein [Bacteroidales bacterium]
MATIGKFGKRDTQYNEIIDIMLDVIIKKDTDFYKYENRFSKIENIKSVCVFAASTHVKEDFTIAIPTYNRVDLLKEALESAINQNGYVDYNIIVVDNNPQRDDETERFMKLYEGGRVSYYKNEENLYMGGNWNRCAELCKGTWMILLHDDDVISPNFMLEVAEAIKRYPQSAIMQTLKCRDNNMFDVNVTKNTSVRRLSKLDCCYGPGFIGVPTGIVYRRDMIFELGGFPYDKYQGYSYWFHCLCLRKFPCYIIDRKLTYYRTAETNASSSSQLHETWVFYEYTLIKYILRKRLLPLFVIEPFVQKHAETLAKRLVASVWKSSVVFPDKYIERKSYSERRYKFSGMVIKFCVKIERLKTRIVEKMNNL